MGELSIDQIQNFVNEKIGNFHKARLSSIRDLKLVDVIKRKNPYLFKAKNIALSQDLVKILVDAHLSSQEETIFGNFLEQLAIFINRSIYSGSKSTTTGIDLDFYKDGIRYIVSIKSGPNWGNSEAVKKMRERFAEAKKVAHTSNARENIIAVNGCCYGRCNKWNKGDYYKYCGQKFWEFISGDKELYRKIIEPLGYKARAKNEEFKASYEQQLNLCTDEFNQQFLVKGQIDWDKLVVLNSAETDPSIKPKSSKKVKSKKLK